MQKILQASREQMEIRLAYLHHQIKQRIMEVNAQDSDARRAELTKEIVKSGISEPVAEIFAKNQILKQNSSFKYRKKLLKASNRDEWSAVKLFEDMLADGRINADPSRLAREFQRKNTARRMKIDADRKVMQLGDIPPEAIIELGQAGVALGIDNDNPHVKKNNVVQRICVICGLLQKQLADVAGVTPAAVTSWAKNDRVPSKYERVIIEWAHSVGIDLRTSDFVSGGRPGAVEKGTYLYPPAE